MILYAHDIIKKSRANYDNIVEYLIENYFIYSTNIRDLFSAGGKCVIKELNCPQVFNKYRQYRSEINIVLLNKEDLIEKSCDLWKKQNYIYDHKQSFRTNFIKYLNQIGKEQFDSTLNGTDLSEILDLSISISH